jgi:pSer/pThr/pTyr-binding forkhead associated (FHA) protein
MPTNLILFSKKGNRKDVPLKSGVSIIGRRPDCDIRIPLLFVSRKHCRIIQQENKTVVQDLGSANGTFVNSQRIMEAVVQAGDILSIGSISFTIQVNGQPHEVTPPHRTKHHASSVESNILALDDTAARGHSPSDGGISSIGKTHISPSPYEEEPLAEPDILADLHMLDDSPDVQP